MKKSVALLTSLMLLFSSVQSVYADNGHFGGGDGTEKNPWEISSPEHLDNLRHYLGADGAGQYYVLTEDLDLDKLPWKDEGSWNPIGSFSSPFQGVLDGMGFRIKNLHIDQSDGEQPVGLFGLTEAAEIRNLGIENADVTGNRFVGILSGINVNSQISDTYVTGKVESVSDRVYGVGGLTGFNLDTSISDTYARVEVKGPDKVGGLIGHNEDSRIHNTYAVGQIETVTEHVYTVTDHVYAGGLAGYNAGVSPVNSYYDRSKSGIADSEHGHPKSTSDMKRIETYNEWDFFNTWGINPIENQGYPFLRWQGHLGLTSLNYFIREGEGDLSAKVSGNAIDSGEMAMEGSSVLFTAEPDAGYRVKNWYVNDLSMNSREESFILNSLSPRTKVEVAFEPAFRVEFRVEGGNGRLFAVHSTNQLKTGDWVEEGEGLEFEATPDTGFKIDQWEIGGDPVLENGEPYREAILVIPEVTADITVMVEMTELEEFEVSFSEEDEMGSLRAYAEGKEIASGDEVTEQSEVIFEAAPEVNYQVKEWKINNDPVNKDGTLLKDRKLILDSLEEAVDVTVSFELMPEGIDEEIFTFLPPLYQQVGRLQEMDDTLTDHLVVEIYELKSNQLLEAITSEGENPNDGLRSQKNSYSTNWRVSNVNSGERYRINVFLEGSETQEPILLGSVDFTVGNRRAETLVVNERQMLRISFWVALDPELRTRQMQLQGYGAPEVAVVLHEEFDLTPNEAVQLLQQEGFEVVGISNGLKLAYSLPAKDAARVLHQEDYSADETAVAMHESYGQDEYETAESLRTADYDSLETGSAVMDAFGITEKHTIGTLKEAGFDAYAVGDAAWEFANQDADEFVEWLYYYDYDAEEMIMIGLAIKGLPLQAKLVAAYAAGYTAMELAVALRDLDDTLDDVGFAKLFKASGLPLEVVGDYLDQNRKLAVQSIASILHTAGYSAVETVGAIRYGLDEMKATGIPILRDAAYDVIDIAGVMTDTYGQSMEEIAKLFHDIGEFSAEDTARALKAQFIDTPLETVGWALDTVGYASEDIAVAAVNIYGATGELTAKVLKEIGVGVEEIGEHVSNLLNATDEQVASMLRGAGFVPDEVSDAISAVFGYSDEAILGVMKGAGYTCNQLAGLAESYYGWTGEYTAEQLKLLGYSANAVGSALKSVYGWTEGAVEDALGAVGYAAGAVSGAIGSLFGSSKIICTELHRQGLMSDTIFKADQEFGQLMGEKYPFVMAGYHYLANPIVDGMRRSALFTQVVSFFATPWANEMAYQMGAIDQGSLAGKTVMTIGFILCLMIGIWISLPMLLQYTLLTLLAGWMLKKGINRAMAKKRKNSNRLRSQV